MTLFEIVDGQIVAGRHYMEDVERDAAGIEQAEDVVRTLDGAIQRQGRDETKVSR